MLLLNEPLDFYDDSDTHAFFYEADQTYDTDEQTSGMADTRVDPGFRADGPRWHRRPIGLRLSRRIGSQRR